MYQNKIFVLGSPRSGTSVGGHIYSESHLIPLFSNLLDTVDEYYQKDNFQPSMMASLYSKNYIVGKLELILKDAMRGVVVDKTPFIGMIKSIPLIKELWPKSKIIFCKRRGLENIKSRQKKWPHVKFENHCRDWAASMELWEKAKVNLDFLEVDQFDVVKEPSNIASQIGTYLELTQADIKELALELSEPSKEGVPSQQAMSLSELDWSDEQLEIFDKVCGQVMKRYGYTSGPEYSLNNKGLISQQFKEVL